MVAASSPDAQRYLGNIPKFYLFRALVNFQLWMPIWVIYLNEERGFSFTQITAMEAIFWVAMVVLEVPTGMVADRWGRRASLTYGAFIYAGSIFVFGIAGSYPLIVVSYVLWGAAFTLFSGADAALLYDSLKAAGREHDYQRIFGRAWAVRGGATLAGILIGAPVAALTNLWFPVFISGFTLVAAGFVALRMVEPPQLDEGEERLGLIANTSLAARTVWRLPSLRYAIAIAALVFASAPAISILSQPFLRSHGVDIGAMGWFLLPASVLGMAAAFFAYRITARVNVRYVVALLPLAIAGAVLAMGAWNSLWAFGFFAVVAVANAMAHPALSDYINRRVRSSYRATVLSFNQLLMSLLVAPLVPLVGFIGDNAGISTAYRIVAMLLLVTAVPLLLLWLRSLRDEPTEAAIESEENASRAPSPAEAVS